MQDFHNLRKVIFYTHVCVGTSFHSKSSHIPPPRDVSSVSAVPFRALTPSLTRPQALPLQGCPLLVPEGKSVLTAPSARCNPVRLSVYSAAAGLRLWMDDRSGADISLRSSIFIFIALVQPRVCVPPPTTTAATFLFSFINTSKQLKLLLKTRSDSRSC